MYDLRLLPNINTLCSCHKYNIITDTCLHCIMMPITQFVTLNNYLVKLYNFNL